LVSTQTSRGAPGFSSTPSTVTSYQVWESSEAFEAFGARLLSILAEVGVDPGEPSMMTLHRLEQISASQIE
jgi:hypothetical protein